MFFPRLRRQAKWVFVFLALVFGLGFVAFGVGSSLPSGFADILQGSGGSDDVSVSEARDKIEDNPADAEAQLDLSRAYQRDGNIDDAIPPLVAFVALQPRNEDVLNELAGLYTIQASRAQEEGQAAGVDYADAAGITVFQNRRDVEPLPDGGARQADPRRRAGAGRGGGHQDDQGVRERDRNLRQARADRTEGR